METKIFTVKNVTTQVLSDKTTVVKNADGTTTLKRLPKKVIFKGVEREMRHVEKDIKILFDVEIEKLYEIAAKQAVIKLQDFIRKLPTNEFFEFDFSKTVSLAELYTDKPRTKKSEPTFAELGEIAQLEAIVSSTALPEMIRTQARERLNVLIQNLGLHNDNVEKEPTE